MKIRISIILLCVFLLASIHTFADDENIIANSTTVKVIVNGVETDVESYTINERTYFKLRDVALAISGSKKHFDVFWDDDSKKIHLTPGLPYTVVGGEMNKGDGSFKYASKGTDGLYISDTLFNIEAYEISWNNYYSIRELGKILDFEVYWDVESSTVVVDSNKSYTGEMPPKFKFYINFEDVPDAGGVFGSDAATVGTSDIDGCVTDYFVYDSVLDNQLDTYVNVLFDSGFQVEPGGENADMNCTMYINADGRVIYTAYDATRRIFAIYIVKNILR